MVKNCSKKPGSFSWLNHKLIQEPTSAKKRHANPIHNILCKSANK